MASARSTSLSGFAVPLHRLPKSMTDWTWGVLSAQAMIASRCSSVSCMEVMIAGCPVGNQRADHVQTPAEARRFAAFITEKVGWPIRGTARPAAVV